MNNTEVFNTPVFVTNFTGNLTWWLCLCSATLVYNVLKSKFPEEVEHWRQKTPFRYLLPAPRDVPELLNEVIKGQENLVDVVSEFRDIGAKMLQVLIKETRRRTDALQPQPRGSQEEDHQSLALSKKKENWKESAKECTARGSAPARSRSRPLRPTHPSSLRPPPTHPVRPTNLNPLSTPLTHFF